MDDTTATSRERDDPEWTPRIDRLMRRWLDRRAALRDGMFALAVYGLGYAAALLLLAVGGARPGTRPWLDIPLASYFYWESLFIAPVLVSAGILAAGVLHLLARSVGGRGDFDATMALVGISTAVASLTTLVPDLVVALLLCTKVLDPQVWMREVTHLSSTLGLVWVYLLAYLIAFGVSYPAVARVAHGLSGWRARTIGWSSFVVYQALLYVFIR